MPEGPPEELHARLEAALAPGGGVDSAEVLFLRMFNASSGTQIASMKVDGTNLLEVRKGMEKQADAFFKKVLENLRVTADLTENVW